MELTLMRHATFILNLGGVRVLVDPILSPAGSTPPIENSANVRRNPLVDLPVAETTLFDVDAILVTHTHRDHFDSDAAERLPKELPLFCQPEDEAKMKGFGFKAVTAIDGVHDWNGIHMSRTGGQHGTGEIGAQMGPVSGYVLRAQGQPTVYIAGDTVWCQEVEDSLVKHCPDVVVIFAGAAQFLVGDPITMTAEDIMRVCRAVPAAKIVAVHMETYNHCFLTRARLRDALVAEGLEQRVSIPSDGDTVRF